MRNPKLVLHACRLSFDGKGDEEISRILNISRASIPLWRKTEFWQEFENELIAATKEALLDIHFPQTAEVEHPATG